MSFQARLDTLGVKTGFTPQELLAQARDESTVLWLDGKHCSVVAWQHPHL